jgi:hypothetical protein
VLAFCQGPPILYLCQILAWGNSKFIMHHLNLYRIVGEDTTVYNEDRLHQGIDQRIPCSPDQDEGEADAGEIISIPLSGGLHHDDQQRAA